MQCGEIWDKWGRVAEASKAEHEQQSINAFCTHCHPCQPGAPPLPPTSAKRVPPPHPSLPPHTQVLGRNLEAVVNKSMELMKKWEDQFVSVEHLVRIV